MYGLDAYGHNSSGAGVTEEDFLDGPATAGWMGGVIQMLRSERNDSMILRALCIQGDLYAKGKPWWNPVVETQVTDRAQRVDQTQSVWEVKPVAQVRIKGRILALQERQAALADSVYSGVNARKQPLFTERDLAELL
jgi:hypothetical protein